MISLNVSFFPSEFTLSKKKDPIPILATKASAWGNSDCFEAITGKFPHADAFVKGMQGKTEAEIRARVESLDELLEGEVYYKLKTAVKSSYFSKISTQKKDSRFL